MESDSVVVGDDEHGHDHDANSTMLMVTTVARERTRQFTSDRWQCGGGQALSPVYSGCVWLCPCACACSLNNRDTYLSTYLVKCIYVCDSLQQITSSVYHGGLAADHINTVDVSPLVLRFTRHHLARYVCVKYYFRSTRHHSYPVQELDTYAPDIYIQLLITLY